MKTIISFLKCKSILAFPPPRGMIVGASNHPLYPWEFPTILPNKACNKLDAISAVQSFGRRDLLVLEALEVGGLSRALEVGADFRVELLLAQHLIHTLLLVNLLLHALLPFSTHLLNTLLVVELRVIVLADTTEPLPQTEMLGVDGNAVVIVLATGADEGPAALLLLEIEAGGIGHKHNSQKDTGQPEPGHDVELGLSVNVVVQNRSSQGSEFANGGGETVRSSADSDGIDLGRGNEGDRVGTELVEERRQEIHGLELLDVFRRGVVIQLEAGNDEQNEIHEETQGLHVLATVQLVVDQETSKIVPAERYTDVDQVVEPAGHDGAVVRQDDSDEFALEQLVSVEEDVVHVPSAGGSEDTAAEVSESHGKRLSVVPGDRVLLLGESQLLVGVGLNFVGTEVH